MELGEYVRLIGRSWWALLAFALVGLILAAGVTALQRPVYRATAKAYVTTTSALTATDQSAAVAFAQQIVKSYADVASTPYVLDPVITELHLDTTPAELAKRVTASANQNSVVLDIEVQDPSAKLAADIANAVTQRLSTVVVQNLSPTGPAKAGGVKVTQVQSAAPPERPSSPVLPLNLAIGLLLGLAAGVGGVTIRNALDTRLRTLAALHDVTDLPVLGAIPQDRSARRHPLMVSGRSGARAEAFRAVATNLQFFGVDDRLRSALVTSAASGEGKSTTAANLAIAIAEAGGRVVLVDADLRRAGAAALFGVDGEQGLTDVLLGTVTLDDALVATNAEGLHLLPAGTLPPNPTQLLRSERMQQLADQLEERFDMVIFDSPPVLPVADAAILARRAGGVLVVCAIRRTRAPQLRAVLQAFEQVRVQVTGIIATMVPPQPGIGAYGYQPREKRSAPGVVPRPAPSPRPRRT